MSSKPTLYSAWFCPFAQRAWMALEQKGVSYEYTEVDPYKKTPEFLAVCPRGMVPSIIDNGKVVIESAICVEYVDEAYPGPPLLPADAYERAQARIWSDHINKFIIRPFYAYLMKGVKEEGMKIVDGLLQLVEAMSKDGPFFSGSQLGMVDIMVAPWVFRFYILDHYRGFKIPEDDRFARFRLWWDAVKESPSFKATLPKPDQDLLQSYKRYATGAATSKVADAIRNNTSLP